MNLIFKTASESWEFEEIHKLNYETFVEEIPQHARNSEGSLVDKFHEQNTYAICLDGKQLVGMMAFRGARPFSLDSKLENLDAYLPQGRKACETRLLAVRKSARYGAVLIGLLRMALEYAVKYGYDMTVISGTVRQQKLYKHMGFIPFGPMVGTPGAMYQPMYLTIEVLRKAVSGLDEAGGKVDDRESKTVVNLLPGPVQVHQSVLEAFRIAPFSHRSGQFVKEFNDTKRMLCELGNTRYAEIFQGSGTLANDVIATELSLESSRGLILANGEFGERLVDHARRHNLEFDVVRSEWGELLDCRLVDEYLAQHPDVRWLWFVHCETSTGVLNDLPGIAGLCKSRDVKVCVDAISSIGTLPVDLGEVYLASCVSGKGIAALPGLSVVFHNHQITSKERAVPRYLDLGYYAAMNGIPFTFSSNLLHAFREALKLVNAEVRFKMIEQLSVWLRAEIRKRGCRILAPDDCTSPAVTTLVLPPSINSRKVGRELEARGCLLSCNSGYLVERNWLQFCVMGECSFESLAWAVDQFSEVVKGEMK